MTTPAILAARGLTTAPLPDGARVLDGVDLGVAPGDRLVLSGPSGSGKSTLLRCLVLLEPVTGELRLDGEAVGPERVRELRRRVGYVPQQPVAIAPTVGENLEFARSLRRDGAAPPAAGPAAELPDPWSLLERLGLGGLEPERRFDRLSGGEQQRVSLVRSLSAGPDVLLLDEPTASLDPENVDDVVALLREWVEGDAGRALVWVSHQTDRVEPLATRRVTMAELGP